jgi:hypothetical protein
MSRNIAAKLEKGRDLTEDDLRYMRDRGMELPEGYEDPDAEGSYEDMTTGDLRAELQERGLDPKGRKQELIQRLLESDGVA